MIITCSNCSARYQLADSKVKASGTKVRCPKCSNKFIIFPEGTSVTGERTEMLGRASSPRMPTAVSPKSSDTHIQERPAMVTHSQQKKPADESDISFNQPTRAYEAFDRPSAARAAPTQPAPPVEDEMTPVFERPVHQPHIAAPEEAHEEPQVRSEDGSFSAEGGEVQNSQEDSGTPSNLRPFGAETLFEIQKADRKRGFPRWVGVSVLVVALLSGTYFSFPYVQSILNREPSASATRISIERPSGWYRDDPGVYQEEMVRQAGLPPAEKEKPENVAVLAEALVLNGILSNAQDQINQGLLFAQKIQLEFPQSVAPLYSLSANAIAVDQLPLMKTILQRWPEPNRGDPEFRLLEFMTAIREGKVSEGLQMAKDLLTDFPDFQRANDYALWMSLQNGAAASAIIDRKFRDQLGTRYDGQRNLRERSLATLPSLYVEIDRLLGRKPKSQEVSTTKAESGTTREDDIRPTPRAVESVASLPGPTPRLEEKAPSIVEPKKAKAPVKKESRRLPPPSEELVENTKLDTKEKKDARKFLSQGNDFYRKGDVDGALAAYRQALKLDPEFSDVYKRLGILYMEQKRNDRAARSFKIYLQLKPQAPDRKEVEGWISKLQ
jgi:predicted Zn finger-like uncharacterized protein